MLIIYKSDYNNWCVIVLICLLKILSCQSVKKACETEYSFVNKSQVKWESKGNINYQIIVSKPPCVDKNNNLVTRICSNLKWYPSTPPECDFSRNYSKYCSDPFISVDDQCVFVKKPQNWFKNCRLPLEDNEALSTNINVSNIYFWLPVRRVTNFGPFEHTGFDDKYGEVFNNYEIFIRDNRTLFKNNCLLYNSETQNVQPESCDNLHQRVCTFDRDFKFYYCPKDCKPAGIGKAKCYCKIKGNKCKEFADINSWFERKLIENMVDDDTCQVANTNSLFSSQGFGSYVNEKNWFLSNSIKSKCSICQRKLKKRTEATKLILSFEENSSELYLLVYLPEHILMTDKDLAVYCFTDASDLLKKKIKIEIVFESDNNDEFLTNSLVVYRLKLEKLMGNYWCEAFDLNLNLIYSPKIVAYKKKKGNEYSLRLLIEDVCKHYQCGNFTNLLYKNFIDRNIENIFKPLDSKIRLMEIFNFDILANCVDILLHISTGKKRSVLGEYYKFKSKLFSNLVPTHITIIYFKTSEYCLPEKTILQIRELNWPITKIGKVAIPLELCLSKNNIPVTRPCLGDFLYGGNWAKIYGYCSEDYSLTDYTTYLYENINSNITNFVEENISDIATITDENLSVLDIYYLKKIFVQINSHRYSENHYLTSVFQIVNELMKVNRKILKQSKYLFNGTDEIVDLIEDFLSIPTFDEKSFYLLQNHNVIVHVTNPFVSNITGIVLYGKNNKSLTNYTVKNFKRNDRLENTDLNNLELAIYLSDSVLNEISDHFNNETSNVTVITTIFVNDSLFIDSKYKSISNVININIPGYGSYLKNPISMLFKSEGAVDECAFWDYGKKTQRKPGEWSTLGNVYLGNLSDYNLYNCSFVHLTHFALLIMSKTDFVDETELIFYPDSDDNHDFMLNLITICGGCLSLFGISGIFLTAIIFEEWRRKIGTKLLLNLSISILLENLSIHFSEIDTIAKSASGCKILGIFLHYIILSKFCWMLISAFLQYLRFVKVIGLELNNIILKSVIIGWGTPIFPVLIAGLTTTDSYTSTVYQLCYPKGLAFYLGILLPILLIVLANLGVFCIIMFKVTRKNFETKNHSSSARLQFYLAVLLFFMLGLPWIFGLLAEIISNRNLKIILFYTFCITATLQGFIMFLFYVVLNKEMRNKWIKYIKTMKR